MIGKLFAHLRQQWLGALAAALVLTGGAAHALDGSNTVFSDDIVNGEVRTADIRDANLTTADIRSDAVITGKIADGTIRDDDLERVEFFRTETARLQDTTPPGGRRRRSGAVHDRACRPGLVLRQRKRRDAEGRGPTDRRRPGRGTRAGRRRGRARRLRCAVHRHQVQRHGGCRPGEFVRHPRQRADLGNRRRRGHGRPGDRPVRGQRPRHGLTAGVSLRPGSA